MNPKVLARAMGHYVPDERYEALAPAFARALNRADCTTPRRAAMFAAQIGHESLGLKYLEEIASGSAYEGRTDLGNTQPGDGVRFKGRSAIQITGRASYTALSAWACDNGYVPTATYFVDHPHRLSSDRYCFLGAIWYWTVARDLNTPSDRGDIHEVTRLINGGYNGLDDRMARYKRCKRLARRLVMGAKGGAHKAKRIARWTRRLDRMKRSVKTRQAKRTLTNIIQDVRGRLKR